MNPDPQRRRRITLFAIFMAVAMACLAYRVLTGRHLEQTAALFIGLPLILGATLIFGVKQPQSITGILMMAITLLLLLSMIVLGEGFICVLMAAPIFYLVGATVGLIIDALTKPRSNRNTALVFLPFFAMSLEGVAPVLSFARENTVVVEATVHGVQSAVEKRLAAPLQFQRPLPLFLRLGFPIPRRSAGEGLSPGAVRTVHFEGGEGAPGDLSMRVEERGPNWVRFRFTNDTSHIAHWLAWESATGVWLDAGPENSRIRWTVHYRRLLDPAWYFAPLERLGVRLAAEYLLLDVAGQ